MYLKGLVILNLTLFRVGILKEKNECSKKK